MGGARIKDRYRWAIWNGRLSVHGGTLQNFSSAGFEHCEETAWRSGPGKIGFHSETYGDADSIEVEVADLAHARFLVEGTIGGFVKSGDTRSRPRNYPPEFRWEVSGDELLAQGEMRLDLGGVDLFLAFERVTNADLPRDLAGHFTVEPVNGPFGFRPVYLFGRQRDDSKIWSSAQFITFRPSAP